MKEQMKKIAVLVSGGGTNLQALIDAGERGELGCGKITLVIASKPGVYALERAKNHGIASLVLARKEYDSIAAYSKALTDALLAAEVDLVVLAGFLTIIDGKNSANCFQLQASQELFPVILKMLFSMSKFCRNSS